MKIRRVAWTTYSIPFAQEFATSRGSDAVREGLLLRMTTDDGLVGLGEAAPLRSFEGGTLDQTIGAISGLAPSLIGLDPIASASLAGESSARRHIPTAAACAVDLASLDLIAQSEEVPLAGIFSGMVEDEVPVNASVGLADDKAAAAAARQAVEAGFPCVKLKVGLPGSDDVKRVAAVREAMGAGAALRLDANGAWKVDQAISIIRALEQFEIELVEQPVRSYELDGLARVRAAVHTSIAADEAAAGLTQAARVVAARAADVLIVKLMPAGGPGPANRVLDLAYPAGLRAIVTTTIESGVGIAAALHLAASLPPPVLPCGLATASLLAADLLVEPLSIDHGRMRVPEGPGLGVALDERQLALYATPWEEVSG